MTIDEINLWAVKSTCFALLYYKLEGNLICRKNLSTFYSILLAFFLSQIRFSTAFFFVLSLFCIYEYKYGTVLIYWIMSRKQFAVSIFRDDVIDFNKCKQHFKMSIQNIQYMWGEKALIDLTHLNYSRRFFSSKEHWRKCTIKTFWFINCTWLDFHLKLVNKSINID